MRFFDKLKNQKGFTLVEILIVIVIIGILFTVLLTRIENATDKARQSGIKNDFRTLQVSAENYFRDAALDGNTTTVTAFNEYLDNAYAGTSAGAATGTPPVENGTLTKKDPWGKPYQIHITNTSATDKKLVITSTGRNKTKVAGLTDSADFVLAVYYKNGGTDACTDGMTANNIAINNNSFQAGQKCGGLLQ